MAAALRATPKEVLQNERLELLKETMRRKYRESVARRENEKIRIAEAMREVDSGTHRSFRSEPFCDEVDNALLSRRPPKRRLKLLRSNANWK